MIATSPAESVATRRLVRCTVGDDEYCLDSEWLDSIQVIENLYPSRGENGSIGWIRRFDEKVPVFRLADQIHGPSRAASRQGVIIVLRRADRLWALLVDKVAAATEVPSDRVFPLPSILGHSGESFFSSVVVDDSGITLQLSAEKVALNTINQPMAASTPRYAPAQALPISRVRTNIAFQTARPVPAAPLSFEERASHQIISFSLIHTEPLAQPMRFAVTAGQALEIASGLPMIQVPMSPGFVVGLAKWRSMPVPVVDLAAWLGVSSAPFTPGCRLLMCRGTIGRNSRDSGLLAIPAVDDLRKLDLPFEYKPWPEAVKWNSALALGIYRAERSMLVIPDLDAILSFQSEGSAYRM